MEINKNHLHKFITPKGKFLHAPYVWIWCSQSFSNKSLTCVQLRIQPLQKHTHVDLSLSNK